MSKASQREQSYFRQGQVDRKEMESFNWVNSKIWKKGKFMKQKYKERLHTKRLSNMYGTHWFRGWNNPNKTKNIIIQ